MVGDRPRRPLEREVAEGLVTTGTAF